MKIFIVTDMEGINGVISNEQASGNGSSNMEARKWLTNQVNAAVKAAFEMGAEKVLVSDGHNRCQNLILDMLHEKVLVVTGKASRKLGPMEGISEEFDAMFMIGFHGKEGSDGVLPHTVHGIINKLSLNNLEVGEIELNAAIAGYYHVPVALISGDATACMEAKEAISEVETAVVMEGLGMYSAVIPTPSVACDIIYESTKRAVAKLDDMKLYKIDGQVEMLIEFKSVAAADGAALMPGVKRINKKSCMFIAKDIIEVQSALNCMIVLAANNNN